MQDCYFFWLSPHWCIHVVRYCDFSVFSELRRSDGERYKIQISPTQVWVYHQVVFCQLDRSPRVREAHIGTLQGPGQRASVSSGSRWFSGGSVQAGLVMRTALRHVYCRRSCNSISVAVFSTVIFSNSASRLVILFSSSAALNCFQFGYVFGNALVNYREVGIPDIRIVERVQQTFCELCRCQFSIAFSLLSFWGRQTWAHTARLLLSLHCFSLSPGHGCYGEAVVGACSGVTWAIMQATGKKFF